MEVSLNVFKISVMDNPESGSGFFLQGCGSVLVWPWSVVLWSPGPVVLRPRGPVVLRSRGLGSAGPFQISL